MAVAPCAGCSAAVARLFWEQEVAGSIPVTPTIKQPHEQAIHVNVWLVLFYRDPAMDSSLLLNVV